MQKRILLCDDELHILRAAEFKFSRAGYHVQCAANGEEAWTLIEQQLPDVLVTDCQMPRLNGLELARRIKDHPATCHLPVIMLSAKGFELSSSQLRDEYGIVKLLCKPFSPRELFNVVESLLGGHEGASDALVGLPIAATVPTAVSQWL
ncbi:Alkaline phosphatase synthesis transcriptional regulatory protein PhoP [Anatilimnocola aggregata]|uniref:Alkaline phosphatase synthesis transcriptional regulatory protein PhoP n=1 Tax=Anatilimnocola aggregata TaxID=2528021 RepID=A0A517YJB1_9BACT|nr:response regulator [Anatilimnocola aggregata]QDU30309.1 Alkaline phosphatase synthesis transcriptional regulatory protein PhoP [Anatilimnocola aggregata]